MVEPLTDLLFARKTLVKDDVALEMQIGQLECDDGARFRVARFEYRGHATPREELFELVLIEAIPDAAILPGLVNAHMHTWQTALRGVASNWTLLEYFAKMHAGLATVFGIRPGATEVSPLALGVGTLFANAAVGGLFLLAAPTLASFGRERGDRALRQRAAESALKAVDDALLRLGAELERVIENFSR